MRNILVGLVVVGIASLSIGCKSQTENTEADEAKLQVEELQNQLSQKDQQYSSLKAQHIEALRRLHELETAPPAAPEPSTMPSTPDGLEVGRTAEGFQCIRIGDEILFSSGRAEIRKEGEAILKKVADMVKAKWAGHTIRIDGHTDTDPIKKSSKLFEDNWDLSGARAQNVLRFLVKQGVPAEKIYFAGFGETRPLGSSKAKNRRVEVVVVD